jgi:BirA family biotin operon repressor/biotin-[acetyl-CoA-carboxylase] ligase
MPAENHSPEQLARILGPLLSRNRIKVAELALDAAQLRMLGFDVHDDVALIPPTTERLNHSAIIQSLSERGRNWLVRLDTHEVVGSTSSMLNELAASQSIEGLVKMAELQVQGRGRRGRAWMSPYGTNLAISLGARVPQKPDQLGGFSLCIGLAVIDTLRTCGVAGLELKWPNDVLIEGRKIAGILIELHSPVSSPGKERQEGTEIVVGVGVNLKLPSAAKVAIDQPVTDLQDTGVVISRNLLAGVLISGMVDFVDGFSERGFAPMCDQFNREHRFEGRECRMICGNESIIGVVHGVTEGGELRLSVAGEIRTFSAGEVSLREAGS